MGLQPTVPTSARRVRARVTDVNEIAGVAGERRLKMNKASRRGGDGEGWRGSFSNGRLRSRRVVFTHPFTLSGLDDAQPAGTYGVETLTLYRGLFPFLHSPRRSTWMRICRNPGVSGALRLVRICRRELSNALALDAAPAPHLTAAE